MTDQSPGQHPEEFPALHLTPSQLSGLLRGLCECSKTIVCILDWEGTILDMSPSGERLLGWSRQEVIDTSLSELTEQSAELTPGLEQARKEGGASKEITLRHKQGGQIPCSLCLTTWINDSGMDQGLLAVLSDESDWYKFQEDLVRIDRLAEMGRMAAGIVHDLKNPLSIINQAAGWAKVVVEDAKKLQADDRQELTKTLREIEEQTSRCRSITNQILDSVRESEPKHTFFSLQELLTDTLRYLQPELKYPPIEVITDFPKQEVSVQSDYKRLQQVVVNLLGNAIHAIRDKQDRTGTLRLSLNQKPAEAHIRIADNGRGMTEEVQKRIFDLFYTTKPEGMGTGLGLPICRRIVKRLGGRMWFESQVDVGTTFHISLPVRASK